jgi:hypothetical protein
MIVCTGRDTVAVALEDREDGYSKLVCPFPPLYYCTAGVCKRKKADTAFWRID